MRTIITVTMRGNRCTYDISAQQPGKRPFNVSSTGDAGEAAAHAMRAAMDFGGSGYQIFAPTQVMDQIPADMRGMVGG